ncbi:MAG: hypothetical protein AB7G48_20180 [Nitrospiraceae bacterium]
MTRAALTPRWMLIGWLAVLLAGVVTGDFVVDAAFERPDIAASAEADAESEEPEDSGEHLLVPSPKGETGTEFTSLHSPVDAHAGLLTLSPCTFPGGRDVHVSLIEFDSHPPPCFLLPLRI